MTDFEGVVAFGSWDRYETRVVRNTERVLALLAEHGVRATFFVLSWNAERHPGLVRRIAGCGHEVASHGYSHRLIYEQTPDEFRRDVTRSKAVLEDVAGREVVGYRAPAFSITRASLWALDILLECGFRYDSSIFPIGDTLYGIPDARRYPFVARAREGRRLIEFPMTTVRVLRRNWPAGGGAYLRLLPCAWFRWAIRRVNREGQPALMYVHPWELDPSQPRLPATGRRGFTTHYVNLHRTEAKLRRLLSEFRFGPVGEVLGLA